MVRLRQPVRFFWRAYLCEYLGGQRGHWNRYPEGPIEPPGKPEGVPDASDVLCQFDGRRFQSGTSLGQPFRPVQRGVDELKDPGDVLRIREGVYVESVEADHLPVGGTDNDSPIIIEAFDGEDVVIDAGYEQQDIGAIRFRQPSNGLWHLVDPAIGEYESHIQFDQGDDGKNLFDRAAFIGLPTYTRLIRYSDINDLRSNNQLFGTVPESLAPVEGPFVVDEHDNFITIGEGPHAGERKHHPWVYMGPGIHHACDKRLHVRLQPTENLEPGITDYAGETDPNNVGLSVSRETTGALTVSDCHNLIVRDLPSGSAAEPFRFGSAGMSPSIGCASSPVPTGSLWAATEPAAPGPCSVTAPSTAGFPPGASARTRRAGTGTDSTRIRMVMTTRWPKEQVAF
jgi:hypothetical protein